MSTTWTQEAPPSITFDATVGSDAYKFVLTNTADGYTFQLKQNGIGTVTVPNLAFIKDLASALAAAL